MTFSPLDLFCYLLLICSNSGFTGLLPQSCKVELQSTGVSSLGSSTGPSPTIMSVAASTSSNMSNATALPHSPNSVSPSKLISTTSNCFPSLNFKMPSSVPNSLDNWWCPVNTEYAFMGFSYEITACWFHHLAPCHGSSN